MVANISKIDQFNEYGGFFWKSRGLLQKRTLSMEAKVVSWLFERQTFLCLVS